MAKAKQYIVISLGVNSLSGRVFKADEIVEEGAFNAGVADELVKSGHLAEYTGKEAAEDTDNPQVTQQEKELDKEGELTIGAIKETPKEEFKAPAPTGKSGKR